MKDKDFVCVSLGVAWFIVCLIIAAVLMGNS